MRDCYLLAEHALPVVRVLASEVARLQKQYQDIQEVPGEQLEGLIRMAQPYVDPKEGQDG